ncbi:MAG TPA: hypothetical protein VM013_03595 [Dehalococcoidia bacterium]|nr:hypothetical protein [Dehalococcoidia bacterium]
MWVLYGLLPPVIVIGLIIAAVVFAVRARSTGGITFPGVLLAYVYAALFVSVFMVAAGGALLVKAGLAQAAGRDFAYNTGEERYHRADDGSMLVDPSDEAIRNDVATGITLLFIAGTLFAIHGVAAMALRRRNAQGQRLISRSYNVLGLAAATIAFLGGGGAAVYETLRRYVLETDTFESWDYPRPGGAIGVAVVFLPLALWFAWRVWQEFAAEGPLE